jgi:DNA repair exonuclease SbcCD ATPase subunit
MAKAVYPLQQVMEVKQKRVDDAEKVVREKQDALEKEKTKLAERKAERDKVLKHHNEKLEQMRREMDEQSTSSPKIQQMKVYLKLVKEKLVVEEKKVVEQQKQVEIAEQNLEAAKKDLQQKRNEVEKLKVHREDWQKQHKKEMEIIEGREQDEIGSIIFSTQKRKYEKK